MTSEGRPPTTSIRRYDLSLESFLRRPAPTPLLDPRVFDPDGDVMDAGSSEAFSQSPRTYTTVNPARPHLPPCPNSATHAALRISNTQFVGGHRVRHGKPTLYTGESTWHTEQESIQAETPQVERRAASPALPRAPAVGPALRDTPPAAAGPMRRRDHSRARKVDDRRARTHIRCSGVTRR